MNGRLEEVRTRTAITAALISALFAASAFASDPPTPGTVTDTLRERPQLDVPETPDVVAPARLAPQVPAGGRTVVVSEFRFQGNSVFTDDELGALLRGYTGRPVTLLELYEAADTVAGRYVREGFTLASVNVPAQRVEDGIVYLEVVEGRIGRISVEGVTRYRNHVIQGALDPLRTGRLYRGNELEQGLRRLNTLPGLTTRAVLQPGEHYGTSDIVIRGTERHVQGSVFADNYGRRSIGEYRVGAALDFNNPLRAADQLRLLALHAEGGLLEYGYVEYSIPAGYQGQRVAFSYGHAEFEVGEGEFAGLVTGRNRVGRIVTEVPVVHTRDRRLRFSAGVKGTRADSDLLGLLQRGTEITLLELGGVYIRRDPGRVVTQFSGGLSTNFRKLERADLATADAVGKKQRLRLEIDVLNLAPLFGPVSLFSRINGVYSPDPLVDTEQLSLGGPSGIRAYPAAEARGDRGYQATVGLQRPFRAGPVRLDTRVYTDAGVAWIVDPPPGIDKRRALYGVGIGTDFAFPGGVTVRLDAAVPLDRERDTVSDGRDDGRVFGSLTYGF
jgi:hemolysin activation/secretion protein